MTWGKLLNLSVPHFSHLYFIKLLYQLVIFVSQPASELHRLKCLSIYHCPQVWGQLGISGLAAAPVDRELALLIDQL